MTTTITLDPSVIDDLGFGELVDACDAAGVEVHQVSSLKGNPQMRLFLAIAWVIARRDDPHLTWSAMQRVRLEVGEGPAAHPTRPRKRTASASR